MSESPEGSMEFDFDKNHYLKIRATRECLMSFFKKGFRPALVCEVGLDGDEEAIGVNCAGGCYEFYFRKGKPLEGSSAISLEPTYRKLNAPVLQDVKV